MNTRGGRSNFKQLHVEIPWNEIYFEKIKVENRKQAMKCLLCNKILVNVGYKRLISHRNICKKTSTEKSSDNCSDTTEAVETERIAHQERTDSIPSFSPSPPFSSEARHETLDSNERSIDADLADFFFGCNIPFIVIESDFFRKFVHRLNPNYKPPTAKTLSGSILDRIYSKMIRNNVLPENEKCVLLMDGWKNTNKNEKYVVATIHNANGERLFLNSWDFTEKSENALSLKDVVEEATKDAKEKYADIYAVVTDNVSTMTCMGKMIDQWHTTCNSHSGNLLAKDLVDSNFNSNVLLVLKEFKSSCLERQLVKLGGSRVILPGDTRWCSFRDSYRCLLKNLSKMQEIVQKGEFQVKQDVITLIFDKSFENELLTFTIIFDGDSFDFFDFEILFDFFDFEILNKKNIQNPTMFWALAEPQHSELSKLAKQLVKIPSSTAAIERLFSQWSYVHNKLRNRLDTERSKKLIHIYYTLKMKDSHITKDY